MTSDSSASEADSGKADAPRAAEDLGQEHDRNDDSDPHSEEEDGSTENLARIRMDATDPALDILIAAAARHRKQARLDREEERKHHFHEDDDEAEEAAEDSVDGAEERNGFEEVDDDDLDGDEDDDDNDDSAEGDDDDVVDSAEQESDQDDVHTGSGESDEDDSEWSDTEKAATTAQKVREPASKRRSKTKQTQKKKNESASRIATRSPKASSSGSRAAAVGSAQSRGTKVRVVSSDELQELREHFPIFREGVQRLLDTCTLQLKSGSSVMRDSLLMSDEIRDFAHKEAGNNAAAAKIAAVLAGIESHRAKMLESLKHTFAEPLQSFLAGRVQNALSLSTQLESTLVNYAEAKLKYDVTRSSGKRKDREKKLAHLEQVAAEAKSKADALDVELLHELVELQKEKKSAVLRGLALFMKDLELFHAQARSALASVQPVARQLLSSLDKNDQRRLRQVSNTKLDIHGSPAHFVMKRQGYVNMSQRKTLTAPLSRRRRWVMVDDGIMGIYRSHKDLHPVFELDLVIASVKEYTDAERQFAFSVTTPDMIVVIESENEADLAAWIEFLEKSIASQLRKEQSKQIASKSKLTGAKERFMYARNLRKCSRSNVYCADCNSRDPEWGIANFGAIVCHHCSGVHRSLGVHISRAKSLAMDYWEPESFYIMRALGNGRVNDVLEFKAASHPEFRKPTAEDSMEDRKIFIVAKYQEKKFVNSAKVENPFELLLAACNENNLASLLDLIARGANVNTISTLESADDYNAVPLETPVAMQTLLHRVVIEQKANIATLEMLIQNGANLYAEDIRGWLPYHYALALDDLEYTRLFIKRGVEKATSTSTGFVPLEITHANRAEQVSKLLNGLLPLRSRYEMNERRNVPKHHTVAYIKEETAVNAEVLRARLVLLRETVRTTRNEGELRLLHDQLQLAQLTLAQDPTSFSSAV